jgi:hypothetical protein
VWVFDKKNLEGLKTVIDLDEEIIFFWPIRLSFILAEIYLVLHLVFEKKERKNFCLTLKMIKQVS